jgi:hypothetical protein
MMVGLRALDGEIVLECTVKWARALGLLSHEVGVEFVDTPPEVRKALSELARAAAHNETIALRTRD